MNKKQLAVLWATIVILVLLALFPIRDGKTSTLNVVETRKRDYFYNEPTYSLNGRTTTMKYEPVNLGVMVAGMLPFILVGSGLMITLRDKK